MSISKEHIIMLDYLKMNHNEPLNGITIESLMNNLENLMLKYHTIYNWIQYYIELGLIEEGYKEKRKNTYYITKFGIEYLKSLGL